MWKPADPASSSAMKILPSGEVTRPLVAQAFRAAAAGLGSPKGLRYD
jgi:hypothetical protein